MKKFISLFLLSSLALAACQTAEIDTSVEVSEDMNTSEIELLTLDPNSTECTNRVKKSSELYGDIEVWPLIEEYYSKHVNSELGLLFASVACGEEAINKAFPEGTNTTGIYVRVYPSASAELEKALEKAGFTLEEEGSKYQTKCEYETGADGRPVTVEGSCKSVEVEDSEHQTWALKQKVSIDLLLPLREFSDENWGSEWGGLDE